MAKQTKEITSVEDLVTEKRAFISNILGATAILFLAWISISVTQLSASSKVQERELVNMNKYFTVILEIQQRKLDSHVNNDKIHVYNANIINGLKPQGEDDGH